MIQYTAESVAVLTPGDYDVDNIDVQFGDQCDVCSYMINSLYWYIKYHCICIRFRIRSGICTPMFCGTLSLCFLLIDARWVPIEIVNTDNRIDRGLGH